MTVLVSPFAGPIHRADADRLTRALKTLADPARLHAISLINADGEATITSLTPRFTLAQPTLSHHVGILVASGLVRRERCAQSKYLTINRDAFTEVAEAIAPWLGAR